MIVQQVQHKQEIERGQADAMTRAGIGRAWHTRTLDTVDGGGDMKQRLLDGALFRSMEEGRGLTFYGEPRHYPLFVLLARGMMFSGVNVRVTTPLDIVEAFEERFEQEIEEYRTVRALFLWNFVQEDEEIPFNRFQRARVERLIQARIENLRPTFVFCAGLGASLTDWWSKFTAQRLHELNEQVRP